LILSPALAIGYGSILRGLVLGIGAGFEVLAALIIELCGVAS